MKTLLLQENDIQLEFVEKEDELLQSLQRILSTRRGEFFLSPFLGLSYENFYEKQPDLAAVKLDIREAIFQESRIEEIIELNLDFNDTERKLTINFIVKTFDDIFLESEVSV